MAFFERLGSSELVPFESRALPLPSFPPLLSFALLSAEGVRPAAEEAALLEALDALSTILKKPSGRWKILEPNCESVENFFSSLVSSPFFFPSLLLLLLPLLPLPLLVFVLPRELFPFADLLLAFLLDLAIFTSGDLCVLCGVLSGGGDGGGVSAV